MALLARIAFLSDAKRQEGLLDMNTPARRTLQTPITHRLLRRPFGAQAMRHPPSLRAQAMHPLAFSMKTNVFPLRHIL